MKSVIGHYHTEVNSHELGDTYNLENRRELERSLQLRINPELQKIPKSQEWLYPD